MKTWWSGDRRVEPFMQGVRDALDRAKLKKENSTDIYNRCYEAVYAAIKFYNNDMGYKNENSTD